MEKTITLRQFMNLFGDVEFIVRYGNESVMGSANAVEYLLGDLVNIPIIPHTVEVDGGMVDIVLSDDQVLIHRLFK